MKQDSKRTTLRVSHKKLSLGRNVALANVTLRNVAVPAIAVAAIAVAVVTLILCAPLAWAGEGTEKALHNFNPKQGTHPSSVILGPDGNIYGITVIGGANGVGSVYELTPAAGGRWLETKVIYFGRKGNFPNTVMFGAGGNLFGSEEEGLSGCGAIFELTLDLAGHWQQTILHDFSCAEGLFPESALVSGMVVYSAPGVVAYRTQGYPANTINANVSLSAGKYNIVVQAFDNCNNIFQTPLTITVQ
jgi:uncharacterized repeat protein (TIGR03803 family)